MALPHYKACLELAALLDVKTVGKDKLPLLGALLCALPLDGCPSGDLIADALKRSAEYPTVLPALLEVATKQSAPRPPSSRFSFIFLSLTSVAPRQRRRSVDLPALPAEYCR